MVVIASENFTWMVSFSENIYFENTFLVRVSLSQYLINLDKVLQHLSVIELNNITFPSYMSPLITGITN